MWRCKTFFQVGWGRGEGTKLYNSITLWAYLHMLQVSVSNIKTLWTRLIVTCSCYCVHYNISELSSLVAHSVSTISAGILDNVQAELLLDGTTSQQFLWIKALHNFYKCKRTRLFFSFRKHRSLPDSDNTGEL